MLGLHIVRGDNICVIGEIDEVLRVSKTSSAVVLNEFYFQEIDSRLDLHNMKAEPINPVPHGI